MNLLTNSQYWLLKKLQANNGHIKVTKDLSTITLAALTRRQYIKIQTNYRRVRITSWGHKALAYALQVRYDNWKDSLKSTAKMRRMCLSGKR